MMLRSSNGTAYKLSERANADTVVLIHGLGANQCMWQDFLPELLKQYQVLTYDLYGHGESVSPPKTPSLKLFATQLGELLSELEIGRCSIVGFSLGGMINRRFAMDYPSMVARLVILNSPHEREPEEQKIIEERVAQTSAGGPAGTLDTSLKRWFTPEFLAADSEVVKNMRSWILSNDPDIYTQCRKVLAHGVKELIRPHPPIDCPALVMTCENDSGSTPSMAYGIASEISGAKAIVVPNLQHVGLMERPSEFLMPILSFLKEISE